MRNLFIFFLSLSLSACISNQSSPGSSFLGLSDHQSIVKKYYIHINSGENGRQKTDIQYDLINKISDNTFTIESFNAGLQKTRHLEISENEEKLIITREYSIAQDDRVVRQGDTTFYQLRDSLWLDLTQYHVHQLKVWLFDENEVSQEAMANASQDSIIDGLEAKIISGDASFRSSVKEDTTVYKHFWQKVFVQDLGLYAAKFWNDDWNRSYELIEEMSKHDFEQMRSNPNRRVGFIDEAEILENSNTVQTCFGIHKILDYYNDEDADYFGGKGKMERDLKTKMEQFKLPKESGYLTFRFIINCRGEAGHFMTEEASLDFQQKQFSKELIDYFLEALQSIGPWKSLELNGEAKDAYYYVTFKMMNGEIIEVLP